jgi:(4-(4-[2-(gamma-L-glutamylamino)ethyl]phenoxymethyl)furan-2-yl)methanamine synthase
MHDRRCSDIAIEVNTAVAAMPSISELLNSDASALGTFLTRTARIDLDDLTTSVRSFVVEHRDELCSRGIINVLGVHSTRQALDVEAFDSKGLQWDRFGPANLAARPAGRHVRINRQERAHSPVAYRRQSPAQGFMGTVIGWDIGGVHLKAARAEGGRIVKAGQYASPLRAGTEPLAHAFARAGEEMGRAERNVVTMTGELADTFASRAEGVDRLASLAVRELGEVSIYAGRAGYVRAENAATHVADIASANWHACATLISRKCPNALLVDLGSTTTDVIPIVAGQVATRGYTDSERLAAGELVYTGMVRGFVMATAARAPMRGVWTPLINENFATMADVHRILGTLPEGADLMATADGREKTIEASRARLARMLGSDAADADDKTWLWLARWFAEAQTRAIIDAILLVLSNNAAAPAPPIIAAGIGLAMIEEIARRLGCACVKFDAMLEVAPEMRTAVDYSAPAAALAALSS